MNEQVMDSAQAAYCASFVSSIWADHFSRAERGSVEQRCTLRGKKVYVRCLVRDKDCDVEKKIYKGGTMIAFGERLRELRSPLVENWLAEHAEAGQHGVGTDG